MMINRLNELYHELLELSQNPNFSGRSAAEDHRDDERIFFIEMLDKFVQAEQDSDSRRLLKQMQERRKSYPYAANDPLGRRLFFEFSAADAEQIMSGKDTTTGTAA